MTWDHHWEGQKQIRQRDVSLFSALSSQAVLLESEGHAPCPFTTLKLVDCKMDLWSLGRLGQALRFSSLHFLVLDFCK
jgi:hypothetical protein